MSETTKKKTRIGPALLGLRQVLKISIYDCLPIFHQISVELFLDSNNTFLFMAGNLTLAHAALNSNNYIIWKDLIHRLKLHKDQN